MRPLIPALSLALACAFAPAAGAQSLSATERDEVRELVREYILSNPSIIEEAIILLQAEREAEEAAENRARIAAETDALLHDPRDFAIGPEDAPVQIVEFFDYNCGFCRRSAGWVRDLVEEHPDQVRVVFKESPIFMTTREGSGFAARAALASIQQDAYFDFHFALMESPGSITEEAVREIASAQGLNRRWLDNAMNDEAIDAHITDTLALGDRIGMRGTPFFVVNGEPVDGANFALLDTLVNDALAAAGDPGSEGGAP